LDEGHLALLQWGRWYHSLNEMSAADRPVDSLLENDDELDRWFDNYIRTVQRKAGRASGRPLLDPDAKIPQYEGG